MSASLKTQVHKNTTITYSRKLFTKQALELKQIQKDN
jgi:hypothetical protein